MCKQKGGFILGKEEDFLDFITNSKINKLSQGSNGITYVAELDKKTNYVSKFKNFYFNDFNKPVQKLLIKLCFIGDGDNEDMIFDNLSIVDERSFIKEVNFQIRIFNKTYQYLQPLCPAVVYSSIEFCNDPTMQILIAKIAKINLFCRKYINNIRIGIIAMEYANDFNVLNDDIHDAIAENITKPFNYINKIFYGIYLIIKLAEIGYSHGDYHLGNILINNKDATFISSNIFIENPAYPLLIDFGFTKELPIETGKLIKEYINTKKYNEVLRILYNIPRSDGLSLTGYSDLFGILTGFYDLINNISTIKQFNYYPFYSVENFNKKFSNFLELREQKIDLNIKQFNNMDKETRNNYLLPLDTDVINKMFSGIFPIENIQNSINNSIKKTHNTKNTKTKNNNNKNNNNKNNNNKNNNKNKKTTKNFSLLPYHNNNNTNTKRKNIKV